jgi:hypothetical protein
VKFAALLSGGVILSGLADYGLAQAGYEIFGVMVWISGYVGTMLLIWYIWLRPLDLTGPT